VLVVRTVDETVLVPDKVELAVRVDGNADAPPVAGIIDVGRGESIGEKRVVEVVFLLPLLSIVTFTVTTVMFPAALMSKLVDPKSTVILA
jgi:hypothetical protein